MRPDPVRPLRQIYTRELQMLLRLARDDATRHIRHHFQQNSAVDVEKIREILAKLLQDRFIPASNPVIRRLTHLAYARGVDWTTSSIDTGARIAGTPVALSIGFDLVDQKAVDNLAAVQLSDLEGITAEMSNRIVRTLADADKQGAGVTKISKLIAADFQELGIARIERITRTSLNWAYNEAAWSRIQKYAPYKEWIQTNDEKTRPGHREMKGIVIPVEDLFHVPAFLPTPTAKKKVPSADLLFPGDKSHNPPLAQIINCRCTVAPRFRKP
ncbi:MAG: phage minor head protein [Bacilli bacterium]